MAGSEVLLKYGRRTGAEVLSIFDDVEKAARPTVGDLLYVGQRQRTRILQRTARGVDVDERSFHPYSTKGPVYYYPGKNTKSRKAAVTRAAKQVGIGARNDRKRIFSVRGQKEKQFVQRTRLGLKFSSYAALKAAFGRYVVDLRGLKAPHMLQALIVRVGEFVIGGGLGEFQPLPTVSVEEADTFNVGIYGPEAERASAHQSGDSSRNLPRRKFIGANERDKESMLSDLVARMRARVRKALKQPEGGTPSEL